MDTSSFWDYVGDISSEMSHLRHELSGSERNISQTLLTRLIKNEEAWVKLFKSANINYFPVGFTSANQALSQLNVLGDAIVRFKRQFVSKIFSNMRNVLSDTDTTSTVVQSPTFHIDTLIDSGKLSGSGSVYNAAVGLETALSAVTLGFPSASSAVKPSKSFELLDGWAMYVESLRPACKLLSPDARLLGALVPRSEPTTPVLLSTSGDTDLHVGVAGILGFVSPTARPANHNIIMAIQLMGAIGFVARVESGTMAWADGIVLGLTAGVTYSVTVNLAMVPQQYGFSFVGTADDAAVLAVGDSVSIQTADGVVATGTTTWTRATTAGINVGFSFVATGTERMLTVCTADAGFAVFTNVVNDPGEILASVDGLAAPTVVANARFRDIIGGGNIDASLSLLNLQHFSEILGIAHAFQSAYSDNSVYNIMNLHYTTHAITSSDTNANLDSMIADPLKSVVFWLGKTSVVGVSKYTRIALWRIYYPMICDMLTMARIDGKIPYFLEN
jgi:hypothetical protein